MAESFCRFVDNLNEWVGKVVSPLFIVLTIMVALDVFTRYVLNSPWYYIDINVQIMGTLAVLGGGYAYLHNGHVAVDILTTRFSEKPRAILEVCLFPIIIVAMGAFLWKLSAYTMTSFRIREAYTSTLVMPVYPFKILILVGVILVALQGLSKLVANLRLIFATRSGAKP